MSELPKFSFGAPGSTAPPVNTSLFGNATSTGFGAAGSTTSAPTFSFGTLGTAPPASSSGESKGFSFGNVGNASKTMTSSGESKPAFSLETIGGGSSVPATSSSGENKPLFSFGKMGSATPATSGSGGKIPTFGTTNENKPVSIFGEQSGAGNAGSTFNWGKKPEEDKTGGSSSRPLSGFGNTLQTPAKSNTPSSPGAAQSSNLFGGSAAVKSPNLFGAATNSTPFGSTTPGPTNPGGPSTTPAGPPPASNTFNASTGGNGLFKLGGQAAQASSGLFGAKVDTSSQTSTGTATAPSQPVAGSGLFGAVQSAAKPAQQSASSLFSSFGKPAESPNTTAFPATTTSEGQKSLFGMPQTSVPTSSSAPPSFFNQAPAPSSPSLFSKAAVTSTGSGLGKPSFQFPSLGTSSASQPASTTAGPADGGAAKSPFGDFGKPKSSDAPATTAPATNGFTFPGLGKTSTSTSQDGSAATTTAVPQLSSTTQATSGLGTSQLGASTAGPVPPSQSRLRNKTMDEVLTRWASDLTKYTKEFKTHSEVVAEWDQVLVENMSKISKLYAGAVTSEKQTASVEMQLAAVENQQNELESWLNKYEAEVDDMLAKNGATQGEMGGPDQERERTYKLAEKLGERLEDMGRDLESMIEEVNGANASLSKGAKADEPITQIVRILNSHLTQLQAIDQGTVALQAKVAAAQKTAQGMRYLNGGSHGTGGVAVEDFYRSYMGR